MTSGKPNAELSAAKVKKLTDAVRRGLTAEQACDLIGFDRAELKRILREPGAEIDHSLSAGLAHARAELILALLDELRETQRGGRVKGLTTLLAALDERFDKRGADVGSQVVFVCDIPGPTVVQVGAVAPQKAIQEGIQLAKPMANPVNLGTGRDL